MTTPVSYPFAPKITRPLLQAALCPTQRDIDFMNPNVTLDELYPQVQNPYFAFHLPEICRTRRR